MKRMSAVAAASVLALVTLNGCGSDKATTSAASSASATSVTASPAPTGYHMVTSPGQKVSFAVPDSWVTPSGKMLQDAAVAKAVEGSDLVVLSTKPDDNFAANVNVIKPANNDPRLPSKEEATQQLSKLNATLTSFDPIKTSLGDGMKMSYSMTSDGDTHQSAAVEVPNGHSEFLVITVSARTAAEAEQEAKVIIDTVKAA